MTFRFFRHGGRKVPHTWNVGTVHIDAQEDAAPNHHFQIVFAHPRFDGLPHAMPWGFTRVSGATARRKKLSSAVAARRLEPT